MRILIISYSYTPAITPRAFRWSAITEYWARQGDCVDVVSAWKPGLSREELINGVCVHRVGGVITEALRSQLQQSGTRPNINCGKPTVFDVLSKKQNLTSVVKWIHDRTWKKVYWPDYACLWYFPALKKAKELLNLCNYNTIITVSHPFTGHLVGLNLKKKQQKIKWIVDIGDPFCFLEQMPINNYNLYKYLNYTWEYKIFNKANKIVVTTENTFNKYTDVFPNTNIKIHIIPPLLSFEDDQEKSNSLFSLKENTNIKLIFVGTLHKRMRKPDLLLRLFYELLHTHLAERVEVHFVGSINDCQKYFHPYKNLLNKKIYCHGKVSRSQAWQAMKEADVLVNIGNEFPYQLPSKVVEYASLGKPVLNLATITEDSSAAFFKDYPASLCLLGNDAGVNSEQFTQLIQFIEKLPTVDSHQLKSWLEPYHIAAIADAYKALF